MIKCLICNKEFQTIRELSTHLRYEEKIESKEYYDKYIKTETDGICLECGKPTSWKNLNLGYKSYCSLKCSNSSKLVQQKQQETTMKHYGVLHPAQNKDVMKKMQDTCIDLYGAKNGHGEEQKEKMKQKCLEEYGVEYSWQREDVKEKSRQTKLERYGNETYTNRDKCWETTKKNGWYNLRLEDRYLPFLKEKYSDIIHHYKSDVYPFECDFYVPSEDLYIEFNIFWMHGEHWFDESNSKDIEILNYWKSRDTEQFQYAIKIWTERDLLKKKYAEDNNLNYKVFWSEDELRNFLNIS